VALAAYEAGGAGIHLPLDASHALVAVLRKALEREARERPDKEWQVRAGHDHSTPS
jgi:cohesin loading factor subunit SCC2